MLVVSRGPQAGKQINLDRSHMTVGRSTACDIVQTDLATAYVVGRNYEQAAAVGRDAVRTAAQVSSVRTLDRLRTLQRKVRPLRGSSHHLRELDDRILGLLSRNSRQDGDRGA